MAFLALALLCAPSIAYTSNLPKDFTGTQGGNNWYYYYNGNSPLTPTLASWDNNLVPYGIQPYWFWKSPLNRYLMINGRNDTSWKLPGGGNGLFLTGENSDLSFGWLAPSAGTINISFMANTAYADTTLHGTDDGVWISIYKGGTLAGESRVWHGNSEAARIPNATITAQTTVNPGDMIYLYARRGAWQDADQCYYSITISNDSVADFTPPVTSATASVNNLTLSATDSESGVAATEYYQYSPASGDWTNYTGPITRADGTYSFMIRSLDTTGNVEPYQRITVTFANTAPVANNDFYTLVQDTTMAVAAPGVLANDTDADGNPLTASIVSPVAHGSVTQYSNGSFTYTPSASYIGGDSFVYQANDGYSNSNTATVTLNVTAPVADFTAAPLSGIAPLGVQFNDTSTGSPTGWLWEFNDGTTSALQHPLHTYAAGGSFTVNLSVTYPDGVTRYRNKTSYISASEQVQQQQRGFQGIVFLTMVTPTPTPEFTATPTPTRTPRMGTVQNIETQKLFMTIQQAIDDSDTMNGHTIIVAPGTYTESILVMKALTIKSIDGPQYTVIQPPAGAARSGSAGTTQPGPAVTRQSALSDIRAKSAPAGTVTQLTLPPGYGFSVRADNVIIDGFTVTGATSEGIILRGVSGAQVLNNILTQNGVGISILSGGQGSVTVDELSRDAKAQTSAHSIRNNTISNNGIGIGLGSAASVIVADNQILDNTGEGIILRSGSSRNTLTGNKVLRNGVGITVNASTANSIYNNYFENALDWDDDGSPNTWSIAKTAGTNILGDSYLGGNFWQSYNGTDTDKDGLGDTWTPFGPGDLHPLLLLKKPVKNLDTGILYPTIQQAIDAEETVDGHTILLENRTYVENVGVTKALHIISYGPPNGTIIRPSDPTRTVIDVSAGSFSLDNITVDGISPLDEVSGILISSGSYRITNCIVTSNAVGISSGGISSDKELIQRTGKVSGVILTESEKERKPGPALELTNTVVNQNRIGISLDNSQNSVFSNSTFEQNDYAIILEGESSSGNKITGTTIRESPSVGIKIQGGTGNSVKNCNIFSAQNGLVLNNTQGNTISANTISGNTIGIVVRQSQGNTISNNILANDLNADVDERESGKTNSWFVPSSPGPNIISGQYVGGNRWSDYKGTDTTGDGFGEEPYEIRGGITGKGDALPLVTLSVHNLNTNISYTRIQSALDDPLTERGHIIVADPGEYWENIVIEKGVTLHPSSPHQGTVIHAQDANTNAVTITANGVNLSDFSIYGATGDTSAGIAVRSAQDCNIVSTNLRQNRVGLNLQLASNNTIQGNFITDNKYGILVSDSRANSIYNNYFSNTNNSAGNLNPNIWNTAPAAGSNIINGSKVGGNFWSDYTGSDTSGDGIGDTGLPYVPDGSANGDNAPLVPKRSGAIHINGNANFTLANGVLHGGGTAGDPYVIEGHTLDMSVINPSGINEPPAIWIENTNVYFVIKNCRVFAFNAPEIYLDNVKNGRIEEVSTLQPPSFATHGILTAIFVNRSSDIEITGSTILTKSRDNCAAIKIASSSAVRVTGNTITGSYFTSTATTSYATRTQTGIWLIKSSNCVIAGNTVTSYEQTGISLDTSGGNTVSSNTVRLCTIGIKEINSRGNWISGNEITQNSIGKVFNFGTFQAIGTGLLLFNSTLTTAENNHFGSGICGIHLVSSSNNTIRSNTIEKNRAQIPNYVIQYPVGGVQFDPSANNNLLENNTIQANVQGIRLMMYASGNMIRNNTISSLPGISQDAGVYIEGASSNTITGNMFYQNGIGLEKALLSSGGNLVYNNYFDNSVTVSKRYNSTSYNWDDIRSVANIADYTSYCQPGYHDSYNITKTSGKNIIGGPYIGGNYWSNYFGADTNGDRLGDTNLPYGNTAGCSADYYPLVNPKTTHITKNSEFIPENRVNRGSGTAADPYVIENLDLEASTGHGIWIENTTAYFLIRNCTMHDGKARGLYGIFLQNVTNGRVLDLRTANNNYGAYVLNSRSVVMDRVTAVTNSDGVRIEGSSAISVTNGSFSQNTNGINVVNSTGVQIVRNSAMKNDYGFVLNRVSQSSIEMSNASSNRKTGIAVFNSNLTQINGTTAVEHFTEGGLYVDSSSGIVISGSRFALERTFGILVKNSANITVRNNTVSDILGGLADARGVSLENTNGALIENNTITKCQPQVFDGQGIWLMGSDAVVRSSELASNSNGIALKGSGGEITGNLISGNYNGIRILDNPGGSARTLVIRQNTIMNNVEAGIRFSATVLQYTIAENSIYGNTYGIFYDSPVAGTVTRSALYMNGENDARSDWWDWDGTTRPVFTSLYSGSDEPVNVTLPEMFQVTSPARWHNASWGSPILRAAITNVSSTMNYTAYDAGGLISVRVAGDARAGFAQEKLLLIDRLNATNRYTLRDAPVNGTAINKSFVYDILTYDDGPYELQYELTDKLGRRATGYAQFNIKNSRFVIKNVTATQADRIYTFVRTKVNGVQVTGSDYFAQDERGSFVTVKIKNDGVKEGFGRVEIGVPDYLNGVIGNQTLYISLSPDEERNYTFYLPLTKFTWLDGWTPKDPAVFPADKKIPISAEVRSVPSYAICDKKPAVVPFRLGPIFNTTTPPSESLVYALGGVNPPYDGDGDNTVEAAESHHFTIEFRNIGDEPADITGFVYEDLIHCNTTKYLRNSRDDGFITHAAQYYPGQTFSSPSSFYAPDNAANLGTNLFGKLYPKGTTSAEGQTFTGDQHPLVRKVIRNGYIDWWTDNPAQGIYPPADYAGRVDAIIIPKYTVVGETRPIVYTSPSLNRQPFSVRALNKSFVPAERSMKGGDISLRTYAADPNTGTVQFVVENSNEDVYFQYRADSSFDQNPDGYLWYHVIPPEYTVNVFVDDARDPAYSIPHMRVDFAVKWSMWANELKLGTMALEAVVGIIVDEATGGTVDLEFADMIMSATNTLLQVMNAVESINHGAQPIVKINGITFDQTKVADLASHGLDADYFNNIRNGDIDTGTITTFISAVNADDDLREVFKREILKTLAKNFGLDELYDRMSDPEGAAAADFDELKDKLLEELEAQEVLTKTQAAQIGAVADAAKTFMDMGEWAYNNIEASGEEYTLIYVVDPPDTLSTTIEPVYASNVFGGSTGTATGNGTGHITVTLLPDGLVHAKGEYEADASEAGIDLSRMNEMDITIRGARNETGMAGCVTIVIVPDPDHALDAAIAFKNPSVQKALISSRFEKLENIDAITDGDRIILSGTGLLLAAKEDRSLDSSIHIREGKVHASLERTGAYGAVNWTQATIDFSFSPVINVPLSRTTLDLNVPDGATVKSDLPFAQSGKVWHLDQAPQTMHVEVVFSLLPYGAGALAVIAAGAGGAYLWHRKRK